MHYIVLPELYQFGDLGILGFSVIFGLQLASIVSFRLLSSNNGQILSDSEIWRIMLMLKAWLYSFSHKYQRATDGRTDGITITIGRCRISYSYKKAQLTQREARDSLGI